MGTRTGTRTAPITGTSMRDEYFIPGLKGPQKFAAPEQHEDALDALLGHPILMRYQGEVTEFYKIGALARSLNRSVVTIRKWQDKGIIPKPNFAIPTKALGGKIRLYSRPQVLGLREIAEEEGILIDTTKAITHTRFEERAFNLFRELRQ